MALFEKIFGTRSQREVRALSPTIALIDSYEDEYRALSDADLKHKTVEFKRRYNDGEDLDDLLPEAFAVCREAADRVLGLRPYRVQLIGGIILHQGRIAEMRTGEGKTLVAALPAYLNALTGEGVHIVTVNDYLAKRDSELIGKVFRFLGLTVGLIVTNGTKAEKMRAYAADITYGTNNEFGFDYLRDNMANQKREQVQRGHAFAIVDEVDSILIDEARTPLIISGQGEQSSDLYKQADDFVCTLKCLVVADADNKEEESPDIDADYVANEKDHTVTLTARGVEKAEKAFGIENWSDSENSTLAHHVNQAIRAHGLMHKDVDYVVKDGEVIIVDEFTGRLMFGRRYNDGLHQAIEAKEHVQIADENKTLATITFQNFFRLYDKLSGMTGTALTEEEEFETIYKLDVVEIPTNRPVIRKDYPDIVYRTKDAKFRAIVKQVKECYEKGQPVLIGTVSVEVSEHMSWLLDAEGISHTVLNAKNHEEEAKIIAQAGKLGAVTVSTNMAGRGTDIMLGGNAEYMAIAEMKASGMSEELINEATSHADTDDEEILAARQTFKEIEAEYKEAIKGEAEKVRAAGGLFVIGTERHESRRIDNQLRGRSGRQGDPGESRFFLSLDDEILRLYGSDRIKNMMNQLGMDEDTPLDHKMLSTAIENAQRQIESVNFQTRKRVLEYDDVMNKQREIMYEQRQRVLDGEDLSETIQNMLKHLIDTIISRFTTEDGKITPEDTEEALSYLVDYMLTESQAKYIAAHPGDSLTDTVFKKAQQNYANIEKAVSALYDDRMPKGMVGMRELERIVLLKVVDEYWMDHIDAMDELRKGIGLRGYANVNPVDEYKREGYDMFEGMILAIQEEATRRLFMTAQIKAVADQMARASGTYITYGPNA